MEMSTDDLRDHILGVIMVQQFSLRAGINKFGDKATTSVSKELQKIHDMGTYKPVNPDKMTKEQKMDAMNSLLMISEKRDKKVKSRMVADGSIQRMRAGYKKRGFFCTDRVNRRGIYHWGDRSLGRAHC